MKKTFFAIALLTTLNGCASLSKHNQVAEHNITQAPRSYYKYSEQGYYAKHLVKNVNHYAKWLTQDLFSNLDFPDNNKVFAVVDFALLDSNLEKTNPFGRQLSEAIAHETNMTGFSVIDIKSTGKIQLTDEGDIFGRSEDVDKLTNNFEFSSIITGTMTRHQGGYLVNARIIDVNSNAFISSSQIFIPANVIDAVLVEEPNANLAIAIKAAKK